MKTRKTRSFTLFGKALHNCQPVVDRKKSNPVKAAPATGTPLATGEQVTLVEARIDVGVGNALFIRGEGEGLSWEKGKPLTCIAAAKWVWSPQQAKDRAVFKLLLNDQIWAQGEDAVVEPGCKAKVVPRF